MYKKFHSHKISKKIGFPLTIVTVLLSIATYFFVVKLTSDIVKKNIESDIRNRIEAFHYAIKNETLKNLEMAALFSYDRKVNEAYKIAYSGNINDENSPSSQKARELLRGHFKNYSRGYVENTGKRFELHFHLPPARSLVRLWREKQTKKNGQWVDVSDDLRTFRPSIIDISSGKMKKIAGIEIGSGGFAVRGITGVYDEAGKVIGSVEVLSDFNTIFKSVKTQNSENFNTYMNKEFINIATEIQNSARHHEINGEFIEVSSTSRDFMRKLVEPKLLSQSKLKPVTVTRENSTISYFPILDYSQKQIGIGVFFKDITQSQKAIFKIHVFIILAMLIIVLLNMLIINLLVRRIITNPIKILNEVISKNSLGDLTVHYPLSDVNCSDVMKCHKKDCPLYGKNHSLCFIDTGSFAEQFGKKVICPSILSGKFKSCSECKVYNMIVKDEIEHIAVWYTKLIENLSEIIFSIRNKGKIIQERVVSLSSSITETSATMEELSTATETIKDTTDSQKEMVDEALKFIHQIVTSISSSNKNIEQQSLSIERFSATIEELTASIMSVAKISDEARDISEKLNEAAQYGNDTIHKVIDAVRGIEGFSKTINDILIVISNIAEQTNLLAMNAAIEAAHAGDYGKGFAVVADEIRKLAESSSGSSKEIQKLVKDIMKLIKNAADLGTNAEVGLGTMISDVTNANKINLEVYSSTREQTKGINDILNSINLILDGINEIRSKMNQVDTDSKHALNFIANVKTMSFMVAGATKEQADGSNGILNSILEETEASQKIKESVDELYSIIEKFHIDNRENEKSGLTILLQ